MRHIMANNKHVGKLIKAVEIIIIINKKQQQFIIILMYVIVLQKSLLV